jgi:hypothetical protein
MNVSSLSITKSEDEILLTPYHKYIYVDETDTGNGYILRKYIVLPTDIDIPNSYEEFIMWKNSIALFSGAAGKAALSGVASNGVAIPNVIPVQTKYINVSNILKPSNNIKVSNIVLEESSPKRGGRVPIYNSVDIVSKKIIPQTNKRQNITHNKTQKTHKKLNNNFVYVTPIKNKSKMNTTRKVKKNTESYTKKDEYIERMTAPIPSFVPFPAKPLSTIEKTIIDQMKAYIKNDKDNIISDFT